MLPSPMCSWRSSFEPRAAFASLQCQTFTFSNPTVSPRWDMVCAYPSSLTMSYPATWVWQVWMQAATGACGRRHSTSSATCSKEEPRENSAPAVFSMRIWKLQVEVGTGRVDGHGGPALVLGALGGGLNAEVGGGVPGDRPGGAGRGRRVRGRDPDEPVLGGASDAALPGGPCHGGGFVRPVLGL